jgi:hypothetical protein
MEVFGHVVFPVYDQIVAEVKLMITPSRLINFLDNLMKFFKPIRIIHYIDLTFAQPGDHLNLDRQIPCPLSRADGLLCVKRF